MATTLSNVAGVEFAAWDDNDEPDPDEQRQCVIDEMYFEEVTGDLVIRFEDRNTGRSFDLSIPVKAERDWNNFADSLPRWEL